MSTITYRPIIMDDTFETSRLDVMLPDPDKAPHCICAGCGRNLRPYIRKNSRKPLKPKVPKHLNPQKKWCNNSGNIANITCWLCMKRTGLYETHADTAHRICGECMRVITGKTPLTPYEKALLITQGPEKVFR